MKRILYIAILLICITICDKIYAYKEYNVGDEVTYNEVDYYVIKNSSKNDDSIVLLKKEPLTVDEVNLYGGVGTDNNHVNVYSTQSNSSFYQLAVNSNGYGGVSYYSSATCGLGNYSNCTADYNESEIKYIIDAWKNDKIEDTVVREVRLITLDELVNDLGYEYQQINPSQKGYGPTSSTPVWIYNGNYNYWTMSLCETMSESVYIVDGYDGRLGFSSMGITGSYSVVRPVVELYKSTFGDVADEEQNIDNKFIDEEKTVVSVRIL